MCFKIYQESPETTKINVGWLNWDKMMSSVTASKIVEFEESHSCSRRISFILLQLYLVNMLCKYKATAVLNQGNCGQKTADSSYGPNTAIIGEPATQDIVKG